MNKQIYILATTRTLSSLRKEDIIGTSAKTVKELSEMYVDAKGKIMSKRYDRKMLKENRIEIETVPFKLMMIKGNRIEKTVYRTIGRPAHQTPTDIYPSDTLEIRYTSMTENDMYAKSYGYSGTRYTLHIGVPKQKVHLQRIDGLLTHIKHTHTVGTTSVSSCTIYSHRGYTITAKPCILAQSDDYSYHAETVTKAVKGLLRKIKANNTEITADTIITKKLYQKITGACTMGMTTFQIRNHLPDRMKASDLLPILKKEDAYGYKKFLSAIQP